MTMTKNDNDAGCGDDDGDDNEVHRGAVGRRTTTKVLPLSSRCLTCYRRICSSTLVRVPEGAIAFLLRVRR